MKKRGRQVLAVALRKGSKTLAHIARGKRTIKKRARIGQTSVKLRERTIRATDRKSLVRGFRV
jgi:hypothetical protein